MRRASIAIISKRKDFIRFFELEALSIGFTVSSFERMPAEHSSFDLIAVDAATVKQTAALQGERILFVGDDSDGTDDRSGVRRANYPMPIIELRAIYEQIAYGKTVFSFYPPKSELEEKIVFYRELENTVGYLGRNIVLSEYEARLLLRLCQSKGEAVSREELNLLLGASSGNIADVYICRLRKKLEEIDGHRRIFTVRSKGYRIELDMEWK